MTSNHFLGGSGDGFGGCGVGIKLFSGVWCVAFTGGSPMAILLMPIIGAVDCACGAAAATFAAGMKGCSGACCVRVMRAIGAGLGEFDCGLFFGVSI